MTRKHPSPCSFLAGWSCVKARNGSPARRGTGHCHQPRVTFTASLLKCLKHSDASTPSDAASNPWHPKTGDHFISVDLQFPPESQTSAGAEIVLLFGGVGGAPSPPPLLALLLPPRRGSRWFLTAILISEFRLTAVRSNGKFSCATGRAAENFPGSGIRIVLERHCWAAAFGPE